jgi:uncharacterized membrane protein
MNATHTSRRNQPSLMSRHDRPNPAGAHPSSPENPSTPITRRQEHPMNGLVSTLTWVCAIACGLNAGIFFIFSNTIMKSLGEQPTAAAIATMQSINRDILNPLFLLIFMGGTLACAALAVTAKFSDEPHALWRIAGALVFVVGVFVVTMALNVPLNDKLDAVDPNSAQGAAVWDEILTKWTAYNHVRTVASTAGAVILTLAARAT